MQKSYETLMRRRRCITKRNAVAIAIDNLRLHSSRNVICSRCENNQENGFQVSGVNSIGSVTEVKCKECNETSYVCHSHCYCQRNPTSNDLCSYKERMKNRPVEHMRKSVAICSVMESTVTLLLRDNNADRVCSCANTDAHQLEVTDVDRLGFITGVQCCSCRKQLALSPLEESYVVQVLYHGQSEWPTEMQKVFNGDHVQHIREVCDLLRRHSLYIDSVCPEFDSDDRECCRVTGINKESGKVTEVEFVIPAKVNAQGETIAPAYNQRLQMTCRSGCYYSHYSSPSQYELTYKDEMRKRLQANPTGETDGQRREETNERRSDEAILSCTVLAANASILRRHNIDNTLCQNCKNDDHDFLTVTETDKYGFITSVKCSKCEQLSQSTACRKSRFYYEEIDESVTLERGDHISWHRSLAYWHHAVVTRTDGETITVAGYGPIGRSVRPAFHESTKQRRDLLSFSCLIGTPYRVTYDDCYTNEYAALRAEKFIGKKEYNPLHRNCEHASHWCKTGLGKSDQVATCFRTVGKTALAFGLRIVNMLLLVIFQGIHEKRESIRSNEENRKTFERFEHVVTTVYLSIVFLLFTVWSMYTECNKLRPASVNKSCCSRPTGVRCLLSIRIITRELIAAAGPFLLLWYEDGMLTQEALWKKIVTIFFALFCVTVVSYVLGALIATLLEYASKCCVSYVKASHPAVERPFNENPETVQYSSNFATTSSDSPNRIANFQLQPVVDFVEE